MPQAFVVPQSQFVHISIVQSRVHTNIIQLPLPKCIFFVEIILTVWLYKKKSHEPEEQKWNCKIIYTISQRNVKSAFSFTLLMVRRNFRNTPGITLVVTNYRNWRVNKENDSKHGHIIHCYFLELRPTHHLCNSSANLNMHWITRWKWY